MPSPSRALAGAAAVCCALAAWALLDAVAGPATQLAVFTPGATRTITPMPSAAAPAAWGSRVAVASAAAGGPKDSVTGQVAHPTPTVSALVNSRWLAYATLLVVAGGVALRRSLGGRAQSAVSLQDAEAGLALAATSGEVSRRTALQTAAAAAAAGPLVAAPALAAIPSGFTVHKDPYDGYEFLYPFGWQALQVDGQDVLYKDVIEPLESISVSLTPTTKKSVAELGDVNTVCLYIADKFLTGGDQQVTLLDARAEEVEGITYYTMEFLATSTYTRHALAALAICNDKLFTCVTGCSEKRWKKMESRLRTAIDSFTVFKVARGAM